MQTASKKVINGWAMYDWANSVYNLVITTTFFPIYFLAVTGSSSGDHKVHFLGRQFVNSSLYDYVLAVAYLFVAILYPILTSIADTRGNKKNFMRFFCYMGALGSATLFFFTSDTLGLGVAAFMLAAMGYVGSLVFYNAYLPEIAAPEDRDRISARGFSYGYVGSVIMQLVGFLLIVLMTDKGMATRITFLLVGIWWFSFAQITFSRLPRSAKTGKIRGRVLRDGFSEIKKVYLQVKQMPVLKRYLRGFFFYSMGVQTVMLAATLFGSKLLGLPDDRLIISVVMIQLVAVAGAWYMSRLSARYGNIKVLMGVVVFWILICIAAYLTALVAEEGGNGEYLFYGLAVAVGLVMGGIQSLSRSTYAKLMPDTKDTASFFSYYDFTEKLAIVIGIFAFGFIEEQTGSMKNSVLSLILFFAIGFFWLYSALVKQRKA
ncbi:MFS transporter [Niabella drilacis]|uniref:MFS transporter, UMF1 family n=1 Tax=Niabella drilacis (strain DSM 25811 / CCM 8410 / CCUG 62505 / LMG 26954 / E90) TaxID=1285928 RepID=A0A1G6YNL9_NIADE|nr:MFS transporter [Niabella drilacis]SDD92114.1 MFS transporter, UMF1 family [Niabella drilacis]